MGTLVMSVEERSPVILEMEFRVAAVCMPIFANELIDLLDDAYDLIQICLFSTKSVSPTMWPLFEQICKVSSTSGVDFMEGFVEMWWTNE